MNTPLPTLDDEMGWWVIESLWVDTKSQVRYRYFDAGVARTRDQVIQHAAISQQRQNESSMKAALSRGEVENEHEWIPTHRLIEHLSITSVTTEEEIASIDPLLLEMLQEHEFFLDEIQEDPAILIGGDFFEVE